MLAQLSTIKARLGIIDSLSDTLLTNAVKAVSTRFDRECRRTLARTVNATHEFDADQTEITVPCYPIELVTKFELKSTEAEGWLEQPAVDYLIRHGCVITLRSPFSILHSAFCVFRVAYTAGYVLPGTTPGPGQTPLPDDLEQAAVEQVAAWYQHRDYLGLIRHWPSGGIYQVFLNTPLLPQVTAVLKTYERCAA